jgi:uncharacterized protein
MSKATFDPTRYNDTTQPDFQTVLAERIARRGFLKSGTALAALSMLSGLGLSGCSDDGDNKGFVGPVTPDVKQPATLGFNSIPGSKTDAVTIPEAYKAQVLAPWGEPLNDKAAEWKSDGTNTPEDALNSVGMHHDGMHFFPLNGPTDGLLCINHEYINQDVLHPKGATKKDETVNGVKLSMRPVKDEVLKEIYVHGVTVVRVRKENGAWTVVKNDPHNKRYTGATEFDMAGPLAGHAKLKTKYSPDGKTARGTLNNCGNGYTPWGTYLTCEENWPEYFVNRGTLTADQKRIGVATVNSRYGWDTLGGVAGERNDEFTRFDITPKAESPLLDYRNEAAGHGYIVEIDPHNPNKNGVKRTALGRFRHEGCIFGKLTAGKPLAFYSGHDAGFEYVYKFVSKANWNPVDANASDRYATGNKYMDEGTLYAARFDADGTGEWLPLTLNSPKAAGGTLADDFADLGEIILNTAEAAKLLGATPMDRPEWAAVDPFTGVVYMTMTNNTRRTEATGTNEANPRINNSFGHIVRWEESDNHVDFVWDIFVFGAPENANDETNLSDLTAHNQFASPDGLGFDERGILWIQTDNGAEEITDYTNDQILAVVPSTLANADVKYAKGASAIDESNQSDLRRFMVGPNGCEVTGLAYADNYKSFFVNVQHPKNWPYSNDATEKTPTDTQLRPRDAVVVIEHKDGLPVGEA